MSLVIEMPDNPPPSKEETREVMRLFELELAKHNVCTYFLQEQAQESIICFAVGVCGIHENIYTVRVQNPTAEVAFRATLAPLGGVGDTLSA